MAETTADPRKCRGRSKGLVMKKSIILLLFMTVGTLWSQDAGVNWNLSSNRVALGQPVRVTLKVHGTDQVQLPELNQNGLVVSLLGSAPERSTSMITINGKTTTKNIVGYQAVWSLRGDKAGTYRLNGYKVLMDGKETLLPDLTWVVEPSQTSRDFLLKQSVDSSDLVPGLDFVYGVKWFLGETAQDPRFILPLMESPDFQWLETPEPTGGDPVVLEYLGRKIYGEKSAEILDGRQFTVISFSFHLRTLKPGIWDLGNTALSFQGATGYQEFFDFFGEKKRQPIFGPMSIPANPLTLQVRDFPEEGRPPVFSGLIGNLDLSWEIPAGSYQVGESIPLKLRLKGLLNKPNLDLDSMISSAYQGSSFQITGGEPLEEGGRSYSLRVNKPGKQTMPGIKLNYYDPQKRSYQWARTTDLTLEIIGTNSTDLPQDDSSQVFMGYWAPLESLVPRQPYIWLFILLPLISLSWYLGALAYTSPFFQGLRERRRWNRLLTLDLKGTGRDMVLLGRSRLRLLVEESKMIKNLKASKATLLNQELVIWENSLFSPEAPLWNPESRWSDLTKEVKF